MRVYGVLDSDDCHIDVSKSLRGTKRYAKERGYTIVSCRYNYNAVILFELINNRWKAIK